MTLVIHGLVAGWKCGRQNFLWALRPGFASDLELWRSRRSDYRMDGVVPIQRE